MEPKNLVVSLELAKALQERGYPQVSYFWWNGYVKEEYQGKSAEVLYSAPDNWYDWRLEPFKTGGLAAPTSSEIGEQLPKETYIHSWVSGKYRFMAWAALGDLNDHRFDDLKNDSFESDTEVESRAKCWLHLKKNNLLGGAHV